MIRDDRDDTPANPSSGGTVPAGKSNAPDSVLRKGLQPKSEAVRDAKDDGGEAHKRCVTQQVGGDGNPKKRATNHWGVCPDSASAEKRMEKE